MENKTLREWADEQREKLNNMSDLELNQAWTEFQSCLEDIRKKADGVDLMPYYYRIRKGS